MADNPIIFSGWAIVELMGHVTLAGKVTEVEIFGGKLGRIDIPIHGKDGEYTTQFFGVASIYRISPVTEEVTRYVNANSRADPPGVWGLRIEGPKIPREEDEFDPAMDPEPGWPVETSAD